MSKPEHMFWDSCVFFRYLTSSPTEFVDDIARFITDAKAGKRKIYFSTIAYVEISQEALTTGGYDTIRQFFDDWGRAFIPIEPNPNILIEAGELRDAKPVDPSNPRINTKRKIGTPDAIHLMTCLYARDVLGLSDIVFHSFDTGRGATWEGKCIPMLGFERWYPNEHRARQINRVCDLPREQPLYPDADLLTGSVNDD